MRTPRLLTVATSADSAFGLQERISTVVELVSPSTAPASAVHAALSRDAARHAGSINPKSLVPSTLPRAVWALPVLALGSGLLWSFPMPPRAPDVPTVAAASAPAPVT